MRLFSRLGVITVAVALIAVVKANKVCPVRLPVPPRPADARVVGGEPGDDFIRAHMVSFHYEGCGGSLISKRWAITAAHCVISTDSSVYIGGKQSDSGVQVRVKAIYTHPEFKFPLNDITLVEFTDDVPTDAEFVLVNTNSKIPEVDEYTRAAGYGFTSEAGNQNTGNWLYQVDVPTTSTATCVAAYENVKSMLAPYIETKYHVCAGYEAGKCDSCTADSGGPLVVFNNNQKLVQVGIVSFGYGCAREGIPGGYARLSTYVDWMRSVGADFQTTSVRKPVFVGDPSPATSATPTAPSNPAQSSTPSPADSTGPPAPSQSPNPGDGSDESETESGPSNDDDDDDDDDDNPTASPEAVLTENEDGQNPTSNSESGSEGRINSRGGVNIGAAVGGSVGALAALGLIAGIVLYRRRGASGGNEVPAAGP